MEIQSIQKYIHTSPRKLRLVADMVRKMKPASAMNILKFTNKAAATDLSKAISTAVANAKQKGLDAEKLVFKTLEVNEGPKLRRYHAQARGRVNPFRKKMSHVRIILEEMEQTSEVKDQKADKKGEKSV